MRSLLAVAALAVFPTAGALADTPPPELAARLRGIEKAFVAGQGRALRPSLSPGRVRADLDPFARGPGSYGAGQLQVVFDRIFEDFETRSFRFRHEDVTVPSSRTAFARVRWDRANRIDGRPVSATLTFTLRADGGEWRVLEIRTSH